MLVRVLVVDIDIIKDTFESPRPYIEQLPLKLMPTR